MDTSSTERLLGLFERSHMTYETDRIKEVSPSDPSLSEMSLKALEILKQNQQGYFLMIEGGRIDHAHHAGNAFRALSETIALSKAVHAIQSALSEEEKEDTLILVTADHGHTLPLRGIPLVETLSSDWWLAMMTMATRNPHPRKTPWGSPIQRLPTQMEGLFGPHAKQEVQGNHHWRGSFPSGYRRWRWTTGRTR